MPFSVIYEYGVANILEMMKNREGLELRDQRRILDIVVLTAKS